LKNKIYKIRLPKMEIACLLQTS